MNQLPNDYTPRLTANTSTTMNSTSYITPTSSPKLPLARLGLILLAFFSLSTALAGQETFSTRKAGTEIYIGIGGTVEDDKYAEMVGDATWPNRWTNASVANELVLGISDELTTLQTSAYSLMFTFKIKAYDLNGNAVATFDKELKLEHQNYTGTTIDRSVFAFEGYHKFRYKLVGITDMNTGNPVTNIPGNVFIEPTIKVNRVYRFDHAFAPTSTNGFNMGFQVVNTNELRIAWDYIAGADSYDLEWAFVNSYKGTYSGTQEETYQPFEIDFTTFDFEHNATRINTAHPFYDIPMIYERGFIVWRVRGRGWAGTTDIQSIAGKWSSDNGVTKQTVSNWAPAVYNVTGSQRHEPTLNWQYQAFYSEEGKKKETVAYHDGSMRNRQSITRINSNQKVIVGETFYDHQGRPGIQTVPAPSGQTALTYHDDFNEAGQGVTYNRSHFDLDDPNSDCTVPSAMTMNGYAGSSKYFSTTNAATGDHQDFIPNADFYPFTQIEYEPDNTGRIRRQSIPGEAHRLGNGKETFYFYGQAKQEELDRLFGTNVGINTRYKKNMVRDANGQVSITYIDPYGRTIATALAGQSPDNVEALDYQLFVTLNVDLLNKTASTDADDEEDDNQRFTTGRFPDGIQDGLQMSRQEQVPGDNTTYDFNYELSASPFQDNCAPTVCYPFVYDIDISVTDKCAEENLYSGTATTQTIGIHETTTVPAQNCDPVTFENLDFHANLDVGTYTINKELKVNEAAANQYADQYITDASCLLTIEDFVEEAFLNIDTTGCEVDCEGCLKSVYQQYQGDPNAVSLHTTLDAWMDLIPAQVYPEDWSNLFNSCTAPCQTPTLCSVNYELMLQDVSPNGQYGITDGSNVLTVFTQFNQLPNNPNLAPNSGNTRYNWKNPTSDYINDDGQVAFIEISLQPDNSFVPAIEAGNEIQVVGNLYKVKPQHLQNFADFENAWQDNWAKSLVKYHPEYCYYEACIKTEMAFGNNISSQQFDEDLLATRTNYAAAQAALGIGSFSSTSILSALITNDPYFNLSGDVTLDHSTGVSTSPVLLVNQQLFTLLGLTNINMSDNYNNYISAQGTTQTLFEHAAYASLLDTWYGNNPPTLTNFSTQEQDEIWSYIVDLYLARKTSIQQGMLELIAQNEGCANGYIDTDPLWINREKRWITNGDLVAEITGITSGTPEDVWAANLNQAQQGLFEQTGKCALDLDLEFFLDGLAKEGVLRSAGQPISMNGFSQLTPSIYAALRNTTVAALPNNAYVEQAYSESINGNTLNISLAPANGGSANACGTFSLTGLNFSTHGLTWANYSSSWTIKGFNNLVFEQRIGNTSTFQTEAIVELIPGSGNTIELVFDGETCLRLGACNTQVCSGPSALVEELGNLLQFVDAQGQLIRNTVIALHNAPYNTFYDNTTLSARIGTQAWLVVGSNGNNIYIRPSNSTNTFADNGELRLYTPNAIDGYSSINFGAPTISPLATNHDALLFTSAGSNNPTEQLILTVSEQRLAGMEQFEKPVSLCCNESLAMALLEGRPTTGTANACMPIIRNATEATVNLSSVTKFYGLRIDPTLPTNRVRANAIINGQVEIVSIEFTCLPDASVLLSCETCVPDPLPALSCQSVWGALETALLARNLQIPTTETSDANGNLVFNDFEAEFCERGLKYHGQAYLDYLIEADITNTSAPGYYSFSDFADLNANGELTLYVDYLKAIAAINYTGATTSVASFLSNNYANCLVAYQQCLDLGINTIDISDFCDGGLENQPLNLCTPYPSLVTPVEPIVDPCKQELLNLGFHNAEVAFTSYTNNIKADFKARYIEAAMAQVQEKFTASYQDGEFHHTLYYYDQGGNLVRTVPPQGIDLDFMADYASNETMRNAIKDARAAGTFNPSATPAQLPNHTFATTYNFNSINQMITQQTPDGGKTDFHYDKLSRIVLSQNAKQRDEYVTDRYSYTLYDDLGRIVNVGESDEPTLFATNNLSDQQKFDVMQAYAADPTHFNQPGNLLYDFVNDPNNNRYDIVKTHYDKAAANLLTQTLAERGELRNRITATTYDEAYVASPTGTLDVNDYDRASHYSYDLHGFVTNLTQEFKELAAFGPDKQFLEMEYDYDLISGNVNKVSVQKDFEDSYFHKYEYDADNRITKVLTSQDDVYYTADAKYFYYDHNPLARVEIGDKKVQGQDYAYTIHGWMKGMNAAEIDPKLDMGHDGGSNAIQSQNAAQNLHVGRDAFAGVLTYYDGDYSQRSGIQNNVFESDLSQIKSENSFKGLFNGNIAMTSSALTDQNENLLNLLACNYSYDQLNRIKAATPFLSAGNTAADYSFLSAKNQGSSKYQSNYTYDRNGNIVNLQRNGDLQAGLTMDNLNYFYYDQDGMVSANPSQPSNRLAYVTESAANTSLYNDDLESQTLTGTNHLFGEFNYDYDKIGQLKKDRAEEIDDIVWDVRHYVREVKRIAGSNKPDLAFHYDAMGRRVVKIVKPKAAGALTTQKDWEYTYYLRDAQGNIMSTYTRKLEEENATQYVDKLYASEHHLYGSKRIGLANHYNANGATSGVQVGYEHTTTDPLFLADGSLNVAATSNYATTPPVIPAADEQVRNYVVGETSYESSNHLGNVMANYTDRRLLLDDGNGNLVAVSPDVVSYSDYYAFGMKLPGRHGTAGDQYRFGFNGMEADDEIKGNGNSYDFGARLYDSRVGRWLSVDALDSKYPALSPYNFVGGNPVLNIDPDGKKILVSLADGTTVEYIPGIKPTNSDKFLQQVHEAVMYTMNAEGISTFNDMHLSANTVTIKESTATDGSANTAQLVSLRIDPSTEQVIEGSIEVDINWNPQLALGTVNNNNIVTGASAPSTVLLHEGGHSNQYFAASNLEELTEIADALKKENQEGVYDNSIEKDVITGVETDYINAINKYESSRGTKTYTGVSYEDDFNRGVSQSFDNFNVRIPQQQAVRPNHRGFLYLSTGVNSITPIDDKRKVNGAEKNIPIKEKTGERVITRQDNTASN